MKKYLALFSVIVGATALCTGCNNAQEEEVTPPKGAVAAPMQTAPAGGGGGAAAPGKPQTGPAASSQ